MTRSEEEAYVVHSRSSVSGGEKVEKAKTLNKNTALACADYRTYIASAINARDNFYIGNPGVMQMMLENWANCDKIPPERKRYLMSREEFDCLKLRNEEQTYSFSTDIVQKADEFDLEAYRKSAFFDALSERIAKIKQKKIHSIVFIRMLLNKKEVSGYIDMASRLQKKEKEKTRALVKGETVLQPRKSDLSFMDWSSFQAMQGSQLSDSPFFRTVARGSSVLFRNKITGKEIHTDKDNPGENTVRTEISKTFPYLQVIFFDHYLEPDETDGKSEESSKKMAAFKDKRKASTVTSIVSSRTSSSNIVSSTLASSTNSKDGQKTEGSDLSRMRSTTQEQKTHKSSM